MWTENERIPVLAPDGTVREVIAGEHIAEMGFGTNTVRVSGFFLADDGTALRRCDSDHFEIQRTGQVFIRVSALSPEAAAA